MLDLGVYEKTIHATRFKWIRKPVMIQTESKELSKNSRAFLSLLQAHDAFVDTYLGKAISARNNSKERPTRKSVLHKVSISEEIEEIMDLVMTNICPLDEDNVEIVQLDDEDSVEIVDIAQSGDEDNVEIVQLDGKETESLMN